ncbi:unnamed protein product, partial [Ceratitis capitata]
TIEQPTNGNTDGWRMDGCMAEQTIGRQIARGCQATSNKQPKRHAVAVGWRKCSGKDEL